MHLVNNNKYLQKVAWIHFQDFPLVSWNNQNQSKPQSKQKQKKNNGKIKIYEYMTWYENEKNNPNQSRDFILKLIEFSNWLLQYYDISTHVILQLAQ